jgi:hypothetical protein
MNRGGRSAGAAAKYRCRAEDHSSISPPKKLPAGEAEASDAAASPELPRIADGKKNATGNYGAFWCAFSIGGGYFQLGRRARFTIVCRDVCFQVTPHAESQ